MGDQKLTEGREVWSGSSAGPEAARGAQGRSPEHRTGEDRHLTRVRPPYAAGSAGQGFPPVGGNNRAGLPHGECGVWGSAPRFSCRSAPLNNLIQGNKVPHPCGTRLSKDSLWI